MKWKQREILLARYIPNNNGGYFRESLFSMYSIAKGSFTVQYTKDNE